MSTVPPKHHHAMKRYATEFFHQALTPTQEVWSWIRLLTVLRFFVGWVRFV